jgi:hypothetical protein
MSSPIEQKSGSIIISPQTLAKSDALRQQAGLPPLETVTNVKTVSQSEPVKTVTRSDLANLQGQAAEKISPQRDQENEAVSFLKMPFVGQKVETKEIPSTSILDPLQFVGAGSAGTLIAKGSSKLITVLKPEAKQAIKEGTKDIGLNVKPTDAFTASQRFERQTRTLPKPNSVPSPIPPKTPKTEPPDIGTGPWIKINLGRGIGRLISTGDKGGNVLPKSSPPPKSPPKEVSAGKGLIQIVKEKAPVKPKQITEQKSVFKEYPISLGKSTLQIIPKVKPVTKAEQATKNYVKSIQELRAKQKFKLDAKTGLVIIPQFETKNQTKTLTRKTSERYKQRQIYAVKLKPQQKQRMIGLLNNPKTKYKQRMIGLLNNPKTKYKQRSLPALIPVQKHLSKLATKQNPRPIPILNTPKTPKEVSEPRSKKRIPFLGPFSVNPINAQGSEGGLGGARKSFIGNVPEFEFTGMYNRIETIYGRIPKVPKSNKETYKATSIFPGKNKSEKSKGKALSKKYTNLI